MEYTEKENQIIAEAEKLKRCEENSPPAAFFNCLILLCIAVCIVFSKVFDFLSISFAVVFILCLKEGFALRDSYGVIRKQKMHIKELENGRK